MANLLELEKEAYDVVLADPPWSYYGQQDKWAAAAKFYKTLPDEDILQLHVERIMTKRGVLFLWATSPRLNFAIECIRAWNLHYRGVAFVWVKTKKGTLTPIGAQGIRPSIIKPTCEFVLAASKVVSGRPMPISDESVQQVILAPKREHSRKPDEAQERIERLYPNARCIELFARPPLRPGWYSWGDQASDNQDTSP